MARRSVSSVATGPSGRAMLWVEDFHRRYQVESQAIAIT